MPILSIDEKGCRGCSLCVDICPVEVFKLDAATQVAKVGTQDDCIGCLSCSYICPSQCLTVADYPKVLPLHRVEECVEFIERFLQDKTATTTVTPQDCEAAFADVTVRLSALAQAVVDTMGRAQATVGRKAGALSAEHLPEMYEGKGVEEVMARLQQRFRCSFEFDY